MNKEWVETAMRLVDVYARRFADDAYVDSAAGVETVGARAALEAHLNTPNTDQVDEAERESEIAALRIAGAQLSNIAFNWAQTPGRVLDKHGCATLNKCRKQWDDALSQQRSGAAEVSRPNDPESTWRER